MLNISVTPNPSVTSVTKPADPPAISPELAHALTGLLTSGIDKHKNHIRNVNRRACEKSFSRRKHVYKDAAVAKRFADAVAAAKQKELKALWDEYYSLEQCEVGEYTDWHFDRMTQLLDTLIPQLA